MTKNEFLEKLAKALSVLPQSEIDKTLNYYNEIFADYLEEGRTEEDVVNGFEDTDMIARKIIDETPMHTLIAAKAKGINTGSKVMNRILLILGFPLWFPLLLSFILILLSVYIVIWSVILVLFSVVLSFAAGALAGILGGLLLLFKNPLTSLVMFGCGLICAALTIMSYFLAMAASKALIRLTAIIARKTKGLFMKRERVL